MHYNKTIFHIDVNSAYLSWTAVDRLQHGDSLDLRTIPSVVGGDPSSRHGIILAKSIPAKKYKIQTGESLYTALQKCPDLVVASPRYDLYIRCSNAMKTILEKYSPAIQKFSVDEYFLDYTNMEPHFGDPVSAAYKLKDEIEKNLGFTVNIGISTNKLLAKMASDFEKPNKVHTLYPEEIPKKMWTLPVGDLFYVGRATLEKLHKLRIYTIGELAKTDPNLLKYKLKSHGILIWKYANGIEDSSVNTNAHIVKGIGNSTTISFDVQDRVTAHKILLSLTETVGMRLRDTGYSAQLVSVSIKNSNFISYSHQRKISTATNCTNVIYQTASKLFDELWKGDSIRHLGVRVSEFCSDEGSQISLFDSKDREKQKAIDAAIDEIRLKHGSKSIIRASFLHSGLKPLTGGVMEENNPMMSSIL